MHYRRFLTMVAVIGLIAGCAGPAATPTPAPSTSGPTAAPTATPNPFEGKTVRVVKSGDHSFDDASIGYWIEALKKTGLTVDVQLVDSADLSLRAVVSDAADVAVAMSLTDLVHLVQESSTDVKLLASDTAATDYQLVVKSSIAAVADLAGKLEAISKPGDASELVSHICLNAQGFDYSTLTLVRIGNTKARVAALLAGQADVGAAHIADAKGAVAASNGALKILLDCGPVVGKYPITGMMASGAFIKANPELVQLLVSSYIDAMRWAAANKDAYIEFTKTWVPDSDPAESSASYDYFVNVGFWPVNGGLSDEEVQTYLSYAAQGGVLTGKVPVTSLWIDDSFVKTYLAANGTK